MVGKEFPEVIVIENTINKGYAGGCNDGIKVAQGRYVLILNSDIIICDSAIEKLCRYADGHPEAAMTTCQVRVSEDVVQMTCFRFPSLLNLLLFGSGLSKLFKNNRFFGRELMLWWKRDSERAVDVATGMAMLVRREAIDKVGMMDDHFFLYFEETDWCRRFVDAGWKILFWPGAKIIHLHGGGQSTPKKAARVAQMLHRSMLQYYRKHHGMMGEAGARIILFPSFGVRWLLWQLARIAKGMQGKDTIREQEKCSRCAAVLHVCLARVQ
jgi:GT2 family glycosyltransferase